MLWFALACVLGYLLWKEKEQVDMWRAMYMTQQEELERLYDQMKNEYVHKRIKEAKHD
jgi:hypothetical protein